jgi:hypothetical protein
MAVRAGILHCLRGEWHSGLSYFDPYIRRPPAGVELPGLFYSYAGRALARCRRQHALALELCERGVAVEFYRGDAWCNLAWVRLLGGDKRGAVEAIAQGLGVEPRHAGLRELHQRLGIRRPPVLPFLPRSHPLNVSLGRMRSAMLVRRAVRVG